jgi:hypothetical protein
MRARHRPPTPLTPLEHLVIEATNRSIHGTLSVAAEKIGEELAREMLADPEFRASFQALVHQQAQAIMARLSAPIERG